MIRELLISAGFVSPNTSNAATNDQDHAARPLRTNSLVISGDDRIPVVESAAEHHPNTEELSRAKMPVGATPAMMAMVARSQGIPMSKSAARRKRRKEQLQGKGSDDDDEYHDDDDDDVDEEDDVDIMQPPTESTSSDHDHTRSGAHHVYLQLLLSQTIPYPPSK